MHSYSECIFVFNSNPISRTANILYLKLKPFFSFFVQHVKAGAYNELETESFFDLFYN